MPYFVRQPAILICLLLACSFNRAFSQESAWSASAMLPEDQIPALQEALTSASRRSPDVLSRNLALAQLEAQRTMAAAQRLPSISGSGRGAYEAVTLSSGEGGYNTGTGFFYQVGLNQPLYHWGTLDAAVKISELSTEIGKKNYAEAYRTLVGSVRSQFMALIIKKEVLAYYEYALTLAKLAYETDAKKVQDGALASGAIHGRELALKDAQLAVLRARLEYSNGKKLFELLTGIPTISDDKIPAVVPRPPLSSVDQADAIVQSGLPVERQPMVEIYKTQMRQADLEYKIAKYRRFPKLNLTAGTSLDNQISAASSTVSQNSTYRHNVALVANWNIFDGFYSRGDKQRALASRRIAENGLANCLNSLSRERVFLRAQLDIAIQAEALAEIRRGDAVGTLAHVESEVAVGRMTETALSQARLGLMQAEIAASNARTDLFTKWSALLGMAWADPALASLPEKYVSHEK